MCGFLITEKDLIESNNFEKIKDEVWKRGFTREYLRLKNHTIVSTILPFSNNNKSSIIDYDGFHSVFTGEIFNYNDKFYNDSIYFNDMINHCLIQNNFKQLHNLDGFWGYGSVQNNKIIGITDFLGIKPIYYRKDINAIASDPYSLALIDNDEIDKIYMSNIQRFGYSIDERTPWRNVKKLKPGYLYINGNIKKYWNWDLVEEDENIIVSFRDSILNRLNNIPSNTKISILLSGGLDSSIVYKMIKTIKPEIKITSIFIPVGDWENDFEIAKEIDPDVILLNYDDSFEKNNRKDLIILNQCPVDLGSGIPQMIAANWLKDNGYHLCFTGDGSDELFSGYTRAKTYDSQLSDSFVELPNYHLPRLDTIFMRNKIEYRSPFLSPKVIKWALNCPYDKRIGKMILKKSFNSILPKSVIDKEKKPLKTDTIKKDLFGNSFKNIEIFKEVYSA